MIGLLELKTNKENFMFKKYYGVIALSLLSLSATTSLHAMDPNHLAWSQQQPYQQQHYQQQPYQQQHIINNQIVALQNQLEESKNFYISEKYRWNSLLDKASEELKTEQQQVIKVVENTARNFEEIENLSKEIVNLTETLVAEQKNVKDRDEEAKELSRQLKNEVSARKSFEAQLHAKTELYYTLQEKLDSKTASLVAELVAEQKKVQQGEAEVAKWNTALGIVQGEKVQLQNQLDQTKTAFEKLNLESIAKDKELNTLTAEIASMKQNQDKDGEEHIDFMRSVLNLCTRYVEQGTKKLSSQVIRKISISPELAVSLRCTHDGLTNYINDMLNKNDTIESKDLITIDCVNKKSIELNNGKSAGKKQDAEEYKEHPGNSGF